MKHAKKIIICLSAVLVISIVLNAVLLFAANKAPSSTYPYLNPFEGSLNSQDLLVNMSPLRDELQGAIGGSTTTIYLEILNTGANVAVNGDLAFYPGSLMKIPVAMAVMKNIDSGKWLLSNQLVLTDADKNSDYGNMWQLPSGTMFTVDALLGKLLVNSDDTARAIFLRNLDPADVEDVLQYLGIDDIFNKNLQIGAQKYSVFFRALYHASYLSADSSNYLLHVMDEPHDTTLLRAGIPTSVAFSHKIGIYGNDYSDAGIVYVPGRPYILTVMTQASSSDEAAHIMQTVSQMVYQYVVES